MLEWNRYGFSISEFQLGRYLGVPLISGKLNDVDCMLLLEKNKKSLLFISYGLETKFIGKCRANFNPKICLSFLVNNEIDDD